MPSSRPALTVRGTGQLLAASALAAALTVTALTATALTAVALTAGPAAGSTRLVPAAATVTPPNPSPFPPTAPTDLAATVTAGSVTLTWTASKPGCCSVEGYDISYNQAFNDVYWLSRVGPVTTTTITANIRPATQYSFRLSAHDDVGHTSSAVLVTVVTPASDSGPDTTPPSAPADLSAGPVSPAGVPLTWTPSTDNIGVTGYDVYRYDGWFTSTLVTTTTGTSWTAPVTAGGTVFYVRARDAAGNVSIASDTVTGPVTTPPPTTPPPPAPTCRVAYQVSAQWTGGFVADLTVTTTGPAAVSGWSLAFSFGGNQRVASSWNSTFTQSGQAVTMKNARWNGTLAAGASTTLGLQGTWRGTNPAPTAFTLNGLPCALG